MTVVMVVLVVVIVNAVMEFLIVSGQEMVEAFMMVVMRIEKATVMW